MTQNNNNRNNNNNNNNRRGGQRPKGINGGKRRPQRTHQPQVPMKQKELPEKITFYESLTVAELGKNYTANLLKSLKSYLCLA